MQNKALEWQNEVDNITIEFKNKFEFLSEDQLNWKPNPKSWSIGQIIEHIIKTNSSYFSIPQKINNENYSLPVLAKIPFFPLILGNLVLFGVSPKRILKSTTFKIWEPGNSKVGSNIFEEFSKHQNELKKFILENEKFIKQKQIVKSPANENLVYTFGKAIQILINHEKRHYKQAVEMIESFREK